MTDQEFQESINIWLHSIDCQDRMREIAINTKNKQAQARLEHCASCLIFKMPRRVKRFAR